MPDGRGADIALSPKTKCSPCGIVRSIRQPSHGGACAGDHWTPGIIAALGGAAAWPRLLIVFGCVLVDAHDRSVLKRFSDR